jgi:hypothetical protein
MPRPQRFTTRQYSYVDDQKPAVAHVPEEFVPAVGAVYRFRMGKDPVPTRMSLSEIRTTLSDPFAELVLARERSPRTTDQLIRALEAGTGELSAPRVFVVADGGQIPWSTTTADIARAFRFLLVLSCGDGEPVLFVSTSFPFDSEEIFLQVVGWDAKLGAYQFYDRRGGAWAWAGSSWDSLDPACRAKGPFDSHINGALNMKELKAPWLHWHSMSAGIRDEVLAPDDPFRNHRFWRAKESAHLLEMDIIRPGIRRWNDARLNRCTANGRLTRLPEFMRQVLETSTINIASTAARSATVAPTQDIRLPMGFFLDEVLVNELALDPGISVVPTITGDAYLHCLAKYSVFISDGTWRADGDTHFAFPVPEASFEDTIVLASLIARGVISEKFAAALLMVDFPNPIFSPRRKALMAYVPQSASAGGNNDFETLFVRAIERAQSAPSDRSPEAEFLANWALLSGGWRAAFETRLAAYFSALAPALETAAGFEPLFELADSRRREFRRMKLHEFDLTTPQSSIPPDAPFLQMTEKGTVIPK